VTNAEFTETLGHALNRPTLFTVPKFAARIAFGELADAALLASARVMPKRLQAAGYEFKFPLLEAALRHLLD
jgi:NAD dependent epimerase/dehydratase family enzyme